MDRILYRQHVIGGFSGSDHALLFTYLIRAGGELALYQFSFSVPLQYSTVTPTNLDHIAFSIPIFRSCSTGNSCVRRVMT